MQHHAARIADRLAPPVARQAGLVERMPGLVQHAHQGAREVGLVVARGDAHVVGRAAGEGMRRDVEPAVGEIEADQADQLLAQLALLRRPETGRRAASGSGSRLWRSMTRPQQVGQEAAQLGEQRVDALGAAARLELVEQRVVERRAERRRLGLADPAHDGQHLGKRRQQRLEVVVLPGLAPGHLAGRGGARARLDELGRQRAFMHPRAAHLAQVGGAPGIEAARALLRPRQQIGHVGRRDHAVRDDAQRGELVGAVFAGAFGHHGRAIPVQDRAGAIDGAQPAQSGAPARHRDRWRSCPDLGAAGDR